MRKADPRVRGTLLNLAHRFWRDRNGAIVVAYGLMLPFLLGVVGLGIETGLWYTAKRDAQTQADAAALSGAFERRRSNPEYSVVSAAALQEALRNGFANVSPNTIVINNPPTTGPNQGNQAAVEVIITEPQSLLFSSLSLDALSVRARAVATVETEGTACVLALSPDAPSTIQNTGNPTISMDGCVLAANSNNSSAIDISGSAVIDADGLWTAGGVDISYSATVTLDQEPTIDAWPLADPYASLSLEPFGACEYNNTVFSNVTLTIDPGVYCGGIDFGANATITLNPGTYYIDGGDLRMAASAVVRCSCPNPEDGVTFVLTSSGSVNDIGTVVINGGADVLLRAPSGETDPFKGILVYQDRQAPPSGTAVKFNGGSLMLLTGAVYIPNQTVEWSGGNAAAGSTCTQIIGLQVKFVGNSTIVNTGCDAAGVQPLEIVGVRVTE